MWVRVAVGGTGEPGRDGLGPPAAGTETFPDDVSDVGVKDCAGERALDLLPTYLARSASAIALIDMGETLHVLWLRAQMQRITGQERTYDGRGEV